MFKNLFPAGHFCPPWYETVEMAQSFGNSSRIFNGTTLFLHPSPGPQPCPVNTYRNKTGGISIDDCPFCPPGYNCNITGISDIEEYPCLPGYYCIGQGLPPRKCPAGTMAPEGQRAKNIKECLPCQAGRYCSDPIGKNFRIPLYQLIDLMCHRAANFGFDQSWTSISVNSLSSEPDDWPQSSYAARWHS